MEKRTRFLGTLGMKSCLCHSEEGTKNPIGFSTRMGQKLAIFYNCVIIK